MSNLTYLDNLQNICNHVTYILHFFLIKIRVREKQTQLVLDIVLNM